MLNKKVKKLRRKYKNLEEDIERLIRINRSVLKELQSKCNHEKIAQLDGYYDVMSGRPDERVCEICGYKERDRYDVESGKKGLYRILKGDTPRKVSEKEFNQIKRYFYRNE